jgi:membrane fusion protein, heavy metal efflux system
MKQTVFIAAISLFLFAGCKNKSTSDLHDHDHEDVYLQMIAYSEELELFAEAEPFAAGKASTILAHFTRLSDFKPLDESSITASMMTGSKGVRQTIDKPTRPGIYVFRLTPAIAGKTKIVFDIKNSLGEFQVTVPDIIVHENSHDAIHAAEDQIIEDPNAVFFTKEQSWKFDFATDFPDYDSFGQVIRTVAQVVPAQSDEIIVSAKTSGNIIFTDHFLLEGQTVRTGQKLLRISGSEMADNNFLVRYEEARNNHVRAKSEYERAASLAVEKIISEKELDQAKNEYENVRVVYENMVRNFGPDGQTVKSPVEGFVGQIFVKSGDYVEAGQALMSLNKNRRLILRAQVRQKYLSDLPDVVSAHVRGMNDGEIHIIKPLDDRNFFLRKGFKYQ